MQPPPGNSGNDIYTQNSPESHLFTMSAEAAGWSYGTMCPPACSLIKVKLPLDLTSPIFLPSPPRRRSSVFALT